MPNLRMNALQSFCFYVARDLETWISIQTLASPNGSSSECALHLKLCEEILGTRLYGLALQNRKSPERDSYMRQAEKFVQGVISGHEYFVE